MLNKISFRSDGMYLDETRIAGIMEYDVSGAVNESSVLRLKLFVDDGELFEHPDYQFMPLEYPLKEEE